MNNVKKCAIVTCMGIAVTRGWCGKHYQRWKATGDPLTTKIAARNEGKNYKPAYSFGRRTTEHVAVAEKILGKPLPPEAIVHHVNEDKRDNRPSNLVICPNKEYHNILHRRMRAMAECGNPNFRKCGHCQKWDNPENMVRRTANGWEHFKHRECEQAYHRRLYASSRTNNG